MTPARLLIIDDEPNVLYSLSQALSGPALEVLTAGTGAEGVRLAREAQPDAVLCDVRLPDMSGLDAFQAIQAHDRRLPVVIMTAFTSTDTAIDAMRRGAFDYLLKPPDLGQLREVLDRAIEVSRQSRVPALLTDDDAAERNADRIVGSAPAMQAVYKQIGRVAPQNVAVLILGESGTGKELVARAIYHYSPRNAAPFVAINCAAIPEALLESELFGHERGAFTGADRRRIGKFEQAHGGTVFLDEIGDMSAATQAKLLRVLQEQEFERVGSNDTVRTDVRILAATNKPLEELTAEGAFRRDLFYRLSGFVIRLPPLRERLADLPALVDYFLGEFGREMNVPARALAPETLELLGSYAWPGNVRELQGVLRYALLHAGGDVIRPEHLPPAIREPAPRDDAPAPWDAVRDLVRERLAAGSHDIYRELHAAVDRQALEELLRACGGNQLEAAERLGISRTTLRARLRALGISIEKLPQVDGPDADGGP